MCVRKGDLKRRRGCWVFYSITLYLTPLGHSFTEHGTLLVATKAQRSFHLFTLQSWGYRYRRGQTGLLTWMPGNLNSGPRAASALTHRAIFPGWNPLRTGSLWSLPPSLSYSNPSSPSNHLSRKPIQILSLSLSASTSLIIHLGVVPNLLFLTSLPPTSMWPPCALNAGRHYSQHLQSLNTSA